MDGKMKKTRVDIRNFLKYESVKNSIVYSLVNTERNRELLGDMPHMDFFDMSIIFCCLLGQEEFCSKRFYIYNAHTKMWGVSEEELYQAAEENTQRLEGYVFKNITDVMYDIMGKENPDGFSCDSCISEISGDMPVYVLSNNNCIDGASCILYPNLLRDLADGIDSNFYIIPSSIHEVLIIPAENLDNRKAMAEMLKEGNDAQLNPKEILSYSCFWYSREDEKMSVL